MIKRALDAAWDNDLDAQLDLEREFQREASLTPDYAEGVRAFLERRQPSSPAARRADAESLAKTGRWQQIAPRFAAISGECPMHPVVAVVAPGMMGAAVAGRLVDNGLKVLTSLDGRSADTVARAKEHGLAAASDAEIAAADFVLSILPPGDAVALAQRFAPALTASNSKPVYVDCNAVSPPTAERVAGVVAPTGSPSWTPASSARRRSRAMPGRASTPPDRMRGALRVCGSTASISACSTVR